MCKLGNFNLLKTMVNPIWGAVDYANNRKKEKWQAAMKNKQAELNALKEQQAKDAKSQTLQDTASASQTNKPENKDITSLRVPLNTQGTGSNSGTKQLGLNLLGG